MIDVPKPLGLNQAKRLDLALNEGERWRPERRSRHVQELSGWVRKEIP